MELYFSDGQNCMLVHKLESAFKKKQQCCISIVGKMCVSAEEEEVEEADSL